MSSVFAVRICAATTRVESVRTVMNSMVARIGYLLDRAAGESGVVPEGPFLPGFPARLSGKEIVSIRHSYLWEGVRIEDVGFFDDVIPIQHIRRRGIRFVDSERSRLRLGHGSADEVPHGRGVRNEAETDFHGLGIPERDTPPSQSAAIPA